VIGKSVHLVHQTQQLEWVDLFANAPICGL
jgi:hypothetical protein